MNRNYIYRGRSSVTFSFYCLKSELNLSNIQLIILYNAVEMTTALENWFQNVNDPNIPF